MTARQPEGRSGAALEAAAVRRVLPRFFDPVEVAASLPSTMVRAAELATSGAPEGAIVLADVQTSGRGRLGRRWTTPPGAALMLSVVLRPSLPPARTWAVLAAAGVALADATNELLSGDRSGDDVGETVQTPAAALKWPNDLLIGGRKAAGLLAERHLTAGGVEASASGAAVVLGMGVNVSQTLEELPAEVRDRATSLAVAAAAAGVAAPDRLELLEVWSRNFVARYRMLGPDGGGILPDYRHRLDTLDREVRVDRLAGPPLHGRAVGVHPDGSLSIQLPDGREVEVATGDVEHLRPA